MSSRRNSTSQSGSRRGSCDSDASNPFQPKLKSGKPVSQVKLSFMGKSMELLVPMNEDVNIYDGTSIEGSSEAKSKNNWVEMFHMIDLAFNNLQQQNKELKRTVNELSSKINKVVFHEKKETMVNSPEPIKKNAEPQKPPEYNQGQVAEINKKVDSKIQRVEENILQWIDEETKNLKDNVEKEIIDIRNDVDTKNIELNSKVQASIVSLKEEVNEKVSAIDDKFTESMFETNGYDMDETEPSHGTSRQILDLKNKLHHNCNTLRFLCSEPLSVQFSIWNKRLTSVPRENDEEVVLFNWVNCNTGGAVDDDGASDIDRVYIPISGPYLISLGCTLQPHSGGKVVLKRNNQECLLDAGRCDIVDLNEDDKLQVHAEPGTRATNVNLMGLLIRPRIFITPGTTM